MSNETLSIAASIPAQITFLSIFEVTASPPWLFSTILLSADFYGDTRTESSRSNA